MTGSLTAGEYRNLIRDALAEPTDAGTAPPRLTTLFTPDGHRDALDPDVTVVRGARGVGKTIWYQALQDETMRTLSAGEYQIARLGRISTIPGYGESLRPDDYPSPRTLAGLVRGGFDPYDIWTAVVLHALAPDPTPDHDWGAAVRECHADGTAVDRALVAADERAGERDTTYLLLFDALDRLHPSRDETNRLVEGLLRVALELRTQTHRVRVKVFIRPDMLDDRTTSFPDASKLLSNDATLSWSDTSLYGLLFHLLGNAEDGRAAAFRDETGPWHGPVGGRFTAPGRLIGDRDAQRGLFEKIAGPWMGTNHRRGRTYTWLPNHLMDGIGGISPRSFLTAVSAAADYTAANIREHDHALHWDGIRNGVQRASVTRVKEITEDLPWVDVVLKPLAGRQVPIEADEIIGCWRDNEVTAELEKRATLGGGDVRLPTGPREPGDPRELIDELIEIGILTRRATGKLDLPDVYRIAFDVGRKGGVPRPAR